MKFLRVCFLILGSVLAGGAMGVALRANMGGSTLSVTWEAIHLHFGISIGAASFLLSLVMFLLVLAFARRQIHVGTVVHMVLYSASLDAFSAFWPAAPAASLRIALMLAALVVYAFGLGLYAAADLGRGPYEGLCFCLAERTGCGVGAMRWGFDLFFVAAGWLFGGAVGLCTLCSLLMTGPVLQATKQLASHLLRPAGTHAAAS